MKRSNLPVALRIDGWSSDAEENLLGISPKELRLASEEKLRHLQKLAGLGSEWGVIHIEEALQTGLWVSGLDLRRYPGRSEESKKQPSPATVREMMRVAIAMALIPGRIGRVIPPLLAVAKSGTTLPVQASALA